MKLQIQIEAGVMIGPGIAQADSGMLVDTRRTIFNKTVDGRRKTRS